MSLLFGQFQPTGLPSGPGQLRCQRFSAGFALRQTLGRIRSIFGEYLLAYLLVTALSVLFSFTADIPLIGWLLVGPAYFCLGRVGADLFGTLYVKTEAALH